MFFRAFVVYALIISLIRLTTPWVNIAESLHDVSSLLLFFFILFCTITYADYSVFKETIIKVGFVSLSFFLLQFALSLIGIKISGIFPLLPLSNEIPTSEFIATQLGRERLSGLFQEPAHYSEFMVLVLVYVLFSLKQNSKNIFYALLITISILMSSSASGLAMIITIWLSWLLVFKLKSSHHKVGYIICVFLLIGIVVVLASQFENIANVAGRFNELSGEEATTHGRSSYIRVVRGYIPFMEGDWEHQLFGNGLGTLMSYVKSHPQSEFLLVSDFNSNWINGIQYLLFTTGFFGALLYFSQIAYFFKKTSPIGRTFVICLILMFLSSDSFFSVQLLLFATVNEMYINRYLG